MTVELPFTEGLATTLDALAAGWLAIGLLEASRALVGRNIDVARRKVADAGVTALAIMFAATLVRTIGIPSWEHLARMAALLAMRQAMGWSFRLGGGR